MATDPVASCKCVEIDRAFSPCSFVPTSPRPMDRPTARSVGLGWH